MMRRRGCKDAAVVRDWGVGLGLERERWQMEKGGVVGGGGGGEGGKWWGGAITSYTYTVAID